MVTAREFVTSLTAARSGVDANDAVSIAQALADRGRFDEAIAYATAENIQARNPQLERNLALWRNRAFSSVDRSNKRADWPPVYDDPFPKYEGLPELPATGLDVAHLGGGIIHHGGLIVRGLLSPQESKYFVNGIDKAMAARDAGGEDDSAYDSCWYSQFPVPGSSTSGVARAWLRSVGVLLIADSPRLLFDLIEMLKGKGIDSLLQAYLGERPVMSVGKSASHRVSVKDAIDWHQDGAFLGRDIRAVNLWIALTECGVDSPGLDVIPRRLSGIVQTGKNGAAFDWSVGHEGAMRAAEGRSIVSPHFKPGDAVFFDQLLLHRTGIGSSMTRERWAIETWFFAPSTYPMEQGPLVV
jgi:hypothetical protein